MAGDETVTVSAATLRQLQAAGKLLDTLASDRSKWKKPEDRLTFMRAARDIEPGIRIPEDDIAAPLIAPLQEQIEALRAQNAKFEERETARTVAAQNAEAESELQRLLGNIQKKHRLNDEGMRLTIERMKALGSMDADGAALAVLRDHHTPDMAGSGNMAPGAVDVFGYNQAADDESIKALHANPEKWFDKECEKVLEEFRTGEAA